MHSTLSYAPKPDKTKLVNIASDFLSARSFTEIMSYSLTKGAYYENLTSFKAENCVRILNPLSADLNVMRQTLLFNALEAIQLNVNRRNADLKLYELGNCYFFDAAAADPAKPLAKYTEKHCLAIAVTGADTAASWNAKPAQSSFYTLRAPEEKVLAPFRIDLDSPRNRTSECDRFPDAIQ